jgi:HlyD family secretion protein
VKKLIVFILLAGAVGAGVWYFLIRPKPAESKEVETTAAVTKGELVVSVSSTGRVVSNLDVEVKCKAGGQVTTMPFDVSDKVKKEQLVVELDPIDEKRNVAHAEVTAAASKAKLAIATENLTIARQTLETDRRRAESALLAAESKSKDCRAKADRMKRLLESKLASQEECDTAETAAVQAAAELEACRIHIQELKTQEQQIKVKEQEIKQAQAAADSDVILLDIAKDRLKDTKVLAPMDGVVSKRSVQVGQIIASATSNVGGGTALLTLSDLSQMFVVASVDESDIGRVAEEQAVNITADAFPGKVFKGKVVQIATTGVNASNVVTFEVKIEVLSENKTLLKPEMTANVEIIVARKDQALLVPADAVVRKKGGRFITVADGLARKEEKVEVGLSNGTQTEVVSGLAEGQTVVVQKSGSQSRWNARQQPGGAMGQQRMMMGQSGPPRGGR